MGSLNGPGGSRRGLASHITSAGIGQYPIPPAKMKKLEMVLDTHEDALMGGMRLWKRRFTTQPLLGRLPFCCRRRTTAFVHL